MSFIHCHSLIYINFSYNNHSLIYIKCITRTLHDRIKIDKIKTKNLARSDFSINFAFSLFILGSFGRKAIAHAYEASSIPHNHLEN